jgi:ribosomal protein S13
LLQSLPGFGEIRAITILDRAGISHARRIQGIGKTQYQSLLQLLKEDIS